MQVSKNGNRGKSATDYFCTSLRGFFLLREAGFALAVESWSEQPNCLGKMVALMLMEVTNRLLSRMRDECPCVLRLV